MSVKFPEEMPRDLVEWCKGRMQKQCEVPEATRVAEEISEMIFREISVGARTKPCRIVGKAR